MLAQMVMRWFRPRRRTEGETYYQGGRVGPLVPAGDGTYAAQVDGTVAYDVTFHFRRSGKAILLSGSCTCPVGQEGMEYCKHVWAALLAFDAQHEIRPVPARVEMLPPLLEGEPLEVIRHVEDLTGYEFVPRGDAPGAKPSKDASAPRLWRPFLNRLKQRGYAQPPPEPADAVPLRPVYVLEGGKAAGEPVLVLLEQRLTPTGRVGKARQVKLKTTDISRLTDPLDRQICMVILGAGTASSYGYYGRGYGYDAGESRWHISESMRELLLEQMFQTGRLFFRADRLAGLQPLRRDDGEPWELVLTFEPAGPRGQQRLEARFHRGEESLSAKQVQAVWPGRPGLFVHRGVLSRVELHDSYSWLAALNEEGPQVVADEHQADFVAALSALPAHPRVIWPEPWGVVEVRDLKPQPVLILSAKKASYAYFADALNAEIRFRYDGHEIPAATGGRSVAARDGKRQILRDLQEERRCLARAAGLGVRPAYTGNSEWQISESKVPGVVAALLQEGWTVLGSRNPYRNVGQVSVQATTGIEWFGLSGVVDYEGQTVPLPDVLAAAQRGDKFVKLGDGSLGLLPEEWLARHGHLLELGKLKDGQVRFARTQIALVDALLAELPEASFDETLAAARGKLHSFQKIAPRSAPPGFNGTLRGYQEQGLAWLCFLDEFKWGGCLADDMGLGKTVQVLAFLLELKCRGERRPSLIVVPKSLVFNWMREAAAFTPELKVLDYTGTGRRARVESFDCADLVITTYGTLRRDVEVLREHEFACAILDEAQAIKNPASLNAKSARLLTARNRLVMTGTPVENRLGDLWSLFEFLNPGMVGSQKSFQGAFEKQSGNGSDDRSLDLLQRMLRPFILRRTKEQVAPELPQRSEQTIECIMPAGQAAVYREMREYYRQSLLGRVARDGIARSKVYVLEALLRLRQAACHPGLIDAKKGDLETAKFESLLPMLTELRAEGHKALVFSQFTSFLALLREKLDAAGVPYEYLDGQTRDRQERVDRFQSDAGCPLFLISLKAGGVGLNLTAADYVFILDPWWNPAAEAQAIDRTHRIGQTRHVMAYRLIARDTVESKIIELQKAKRDLAAAIITEANSLIQELTREDLEVLLS